MHNFDMDRLDFLRKDIKMPLFILPDTEKDGTSTDQNKGKQQQANHSVLYLILNIQLKASPQERDINHQ